ncbi:unnamed protein product [Ectocarpus sp. 12 AP-2014]
MSWFQHRGGRLQMLPSVQVGVEIGEQEPGILTVACATVATGESLAATGICRVNLPHLSMCTRKTIIRYLPPCLCTGGLVSVAASTAVTNVGCRLIPAQISDCFDRLLRVSIFQLQ